MTVTEKSTAVMTVILRTETRQPFFRTMARMKFHGSCAYKGNLLTVFWTWLLLIASARGYPAPIPLTTRRPPGTFYFPDDPALLNVTATFSSPGSQDVKAFETREQFGLGLTPEGLSLKSPSVDATIRWSSERTASVLGDGEHGGQNLDFRQREKAHVSVPIKFPDTVLGKEAWPSNVGHTIANAVTSLLSSTASVKATTRPGFSTFATAKPTSKTKTTVAAGSVSVGFGGNGQDFLPACSSFDESIRNTYGICTSLANYPEDIIQRELEAKFGDASNQLFFDSNGDIPLGVLGEDTLPVIHADEITETGGEDVLASRGGIVPEAPTFTDTPMCAYDTKPLRVQAAKNTNNTWRVVVNDKRYVQTVHAELCRAEGESCDGLKDIRSQLFGMETVCKQKYTSRRLLAVKKADKPTAASNELVTVMEYFRLPSCCVCYIRKKLDSPTTRRRRRR